MPSGLGAGPGRREPAVDKDQLWDIIVRERLALAAELGRLTEEEWATSSLCAGWSVKDVAAHVISSPQLTWSRTLRLAPAIARHGYNGMILRDGRRRGAVPTAELLADYERWAPVRRGPASVTDVEPLIDILVHSQDILRPLGRRHAMPVETVPLAGRRARLLAGLMGGRAVRRLRLVSTDTDWTVGPEHGPRVEGPAEELLMLLCGRPADLARLSGDGAASLARA